MVAVGGQNVASPFCQRPFAMSAVRQLYLDPSDIESERLQEIQLVKQYLDNVSSAATGRVDRVVNAFVNRRKVCRPLFLSSETPLSSHTGYSHIARREIEGTARLVQESSHIFPGAF